MALLMKISLSKYILLNINYNLQNYVNKLKVAISIKYGSK
jgi:hypothetical protein